MWLIQLLFNVCKQCSSIDVENPALLLESWGACIKSKFKEFDTFPFTF